MKSFTLIVLIIFFFSNSFSQQTGNQQYISCELGYGIPLNLNKNLRVTLSDSFQMTLNNSFSYGVAFRMHSAINFGTKFEITNNTYRFESQDYDLSISALYGLTGFSYGIWIKDRIFIESDLDIGVLVCTQNLYAKNKSISTVNSSIETNSQNQFNLVSKAIFSVGLSPRIQFKLTNKISLYAQYKYSFFGAKKSGYIYENRIFNNFSNILFGIQINEIGNTEKVRNR